MHRVVRVDQIPLTDTPPHQEQRRKVPGLSGSQSRYDAGVEVTHE